MTTYHRVSGGVGSWLAALVDRKKDHSAERRFVFADTLYEDADCYRFLIEGVCVLAGRSTKWVPHADDFPDYRVPEETPIEFYQGNTKWRAFLADLRVETVRKLPELIWIAEGRDIWEIMRDQRFLGNSRRDPCSRTAKREILDRWSAENCDAEADDFTVGVGPHEAHRFTRLAERKLKQGWVFRAPLINTFEGEIYRAGLEDKYLSDWGLARPRLYEMGYSHNNCGGFCIKAGHGHWANRLQRQPERFAYDEMMEAKLSAFLGGGVAMLTDRTGDNVKKPMPLSVFRARVKSGQISTTINRGESGCGCAIDYQEDEGVFG